MIRKLTKWPHQHCHHLRPPGFLDVALGDRVVVPYGHPHSVLQWLFAMEKSGVAGMWITLVVGFLIQNFLETESR